jgi:hypothetical protein
MQRGNRNFSWGVARFFAMVAVGLTLEDYYNFVTSMKIHGKFSVEEVDNMYPFEREVYGNLVSETIKKLRESKFPDGSL